MYDNSLRGALPPILDDGSPYRPIILSGTGVTEVHNDVPLRKDRLYLLVASVGDVRIGFSKLPGQENFVPADGGAVFPEGFALPFRAIDAGNYGSLHVYVEAAAGGADAFSVTIFQREA